MRIAAINTLNFNSQKVTSTSKPDKSTSDIKPKEGKVTDTFIKETITKPIEEPAKESVTSPKPVDKE